jgi:hypothetical protein
MAASTFILLFLVGGQAARADYQAASTFAGMIGYALFLSYALYPKLLAENNLQDVTSSLKTVLMFAIPMTTIVMSMPSSLLTVLNVHYNEATSVLLVLAVDAFVVLLTQFYTSVIFGVEKLDEEAIIPLKQLARSKIFKVFTLPYIQALIALPLSFYLLTQVTTGQPVLAALCVTTVNLAAHITTLLIQYVMMQKFVRISIPWRNIAKYFLASAAVAAFLYPLPDTTTLVLTLATVAGGAVIYAAVLLTIDSEARKMVGAIWKEIRRATKKKEWPEERAWNSSMF